MGEAFIHQTKGSRKQITDVIETLRYVYKGQTIKPGDLVRFINDGDYGVSGQVDLSSVTNSGVAAHAIELPNGMIFISHQYSVSNYYQLGCTLLSVSGTTILSHGTTLLDSPGGVTQTRSILLPNGNVFIAYNKDNYARGVVVTIDGTVVTPGTVVSYGGSVAGLQVEAVLLPNGTIFIPHAYNSSNYYMYRKE